MSELTEQIESLIENALELKVGKYKTALQEAIGILQALVGEPEFNCDVCGTGFVPSRKVVKTRSAVCSDECKESMEGSSKVEQLIVNQQDVGSTPTPPANLHPRIDYSPEAEAKRSEAQQNRRALEKTMKRNESLHDCKYCGKPTAKLYCSEKCRKGSERIVELETVKKEKVIAETPPENKTIKPDRWRDLPWDLASKNSLQRIEQKYAGAKVA